jgi:uncharacterized protein (TIGR02594 family)
MIHIGVVEDRQDPRQMGRVRVRVLGIHEQNKNEVPTGALPWATVMTPATSPSTSGVGQTPYLVEGSWVVVMFQDKAFQDPIVLGSIPGLPSQKLSSQLGFSDPNGNFPRYTGEPDVNKLARGENTVEYSTDSSISEPSSPFAAQYPFNNVYETESGHIKEYDDTPSAERIREKHRSGSLYEIHPDGSKVTRVVGDNYEVIAGADSVHIGGSCKVIINGSTDITIGGSCSIMSGGNMKLVAPRIDLNPPGASVGSVNPILVDPPVPYEANIQPVSVPAGYPANPEQYEGPIEYVEQAPANCGEVPHRNPYDAAADALALGESNWNETGDNPNITALWDEIGYNGAQFADETAWCAVFVGAMLKRSGNKYIQTASSQAYASYGIEVDPADVQQGDIVVFYRQSPSSGLGHVGFATGSSTGTTIEVLGGNQGNTLSVRSYSTVQGDQWGLRTIRRAVSCEDGSTEAPEAESAASGSTGEGGSVT